MAAAPDGYTIGYLNVPSMYAGYLDRQYNRKETLDSFTPLMNHVIDYNVWAVKADSPFKTVKDVIDVLSSAAGILLRGLFFLVCIIATSAYDFREGQVHGIGLQEFLDLLKGLKDKGY